MERKVKQIQALIAASSLLFLVIACGNNNESTKSGPPDSLDAGGVSDTSITKMPVADTSAAGISAETSIKKQSSAPRKGKATIGKMAEKKPVHIKDATFRPDRNGVYETTEVAPAYPGGQTALENYVSNHMEFPQMAIDDNKEGTVNVQFVVDENGKVQDAVVVGAKLGDGLDEEAERVISAMPKWTPGKVRGKSVKTRLTLPITLKIEQ